MEVGVCIFASICLGELVFVPAFGIMHSCRYLHTHPASPLRGNGRSLYIFSFNALTPLRDLTLYLAALLRDYLPIFATLVIEPLTLRRLRWECGWSYNLSEAIGNSLIKFRIADKTREMDCTGIRCDTERKDTFPLILTGL